MNTPRILMSCATVVALATGITPASAQDLSSSSSDARASGDHHAYQDGGASKEQVSGTERYMTNDELRQTFSEGKHIVDAVGVSLHTTDAAGKDVLALENAGPFTDVKLPAGRYTVVADFGGVKLGEPAELYLHRPKDET